MSGDVEKDLTWPFDRQTTIGFATIAVVVLAGIAAYVYYVGGLPSGEGTQSTAEMFTPEPPSGAALAKLEQSQGFEALISYTENGFEPQTVVISAGDSVRFTNNSSHELWVVATGSGSRAVYPGTSDCGTSALDSCEALAPRDFWEFTFTTAGEWSFRNNLDQGHTGVVRVETE